MRGLNFINLVNKLSLNGWSFRDDLGNFFLSFYMQNAVVRL